MKKKHSFRLLHQEIAKHSFLKRLFYTYTLVSCILFVLFSFLITYGINDEYRNRLSDIQEQNLTQAYRLNQTVLRDIYSICYSFLEDATLIQLLYGNSYNINLALAARDISDQIRLCSSMISSVYLINFNTGTILDNYNRSNIEDHYDTELFSFLENSSPGISSFYGLPRTVVRSTTGGTTSSSVFSIIYHGNAAGAIVINIDSQSYMKLLALESNDYLDWVLLDANGYVFAASDPELFGTDYKQNELFQEISNNPKQSGSFKTTINENRCLVDFRHNIGLNITYISIFNQNTLYTANSLLWMGIQYGILFILLGMIVTYVVSLFVYRPFRSFKTQIALAFEPQKPHVDDFAYLSEVYNGITEANRRLQAANHDWLKEKDRSLLKQLVAGNTNVLPSQYESLNQYFQRRYYRLIIISIDYRFRIQEDTDSINLLRFSITNVMNELFDEAFLYMNLNMVSPHIIYFLNSDEEDSQQIRRILEKGQQFLQDNFKFTLSIGVGEPVSNLDEISVSYQGAQEALSHRFVTGNGSVCFFDELLLAPPKEELYPYETDSAVIAAVRGMDTDAFCQTLEAFFGQIRSFHLDQIVRSILQLDASLQLLENSSGLSCRKLPWELNVLPQLDLWTLQSSLQERGLQDIAELSEIKNHSAKKPELIQNLLQLIDDNLYNPNLSVAFLAGEVNLSINYLRSIFKENTGDSLSNYITQKRIELICRLLADTDTSIQEISDQLGFSTKNYFFTFFKKHTQMTPSEYRRSRQSKNEA